MGVIHGVDRGTYSPYFLYFKNIFGKKNGRMTEWSALQTDKRGDSGSNPAEVKTFFGGIKSLEQ